MINYITTRITWNYTALSNSKDTLEDIDNLFQDLFCTACL